MRIAGDKAPVEATYAKERADLFQSTRVLYVTQIFDLRLYYFKLVLRDYVAEVAYFGCEPEELCLHISDACSIYCYGDGLNISSLLIIALDKEFDFIQIQYRKKACALIQ